MNTDNNTENNTDIEKDDKAQKPFNSYSTKDEINENNCRFQDGEPLKFVRVRFPGHAKSYPFLIGQRRLKYGQKVVGMSDRGMAVGYVNSFTYELPFEKSMLPLRSINKIANEEDIQKEHETYKRQKETETLCQDLIEKHELDMNLTHVEFTQFGKKVVFYFVAPARVDFRGLVKDLVTQLKLRIELRQISVRDRAASQGALGPCGRELCCSSFLSRYGNVNIKMAKNQNLTLNYSKLNGVCGQLKCCLQYEDEVYDEKRKVLPKEGRIIQTTDGERGKVFRLHILPEQFDLLTNKGKIKRYTKSFFDREIEPHKAKMPDRFDHISDETSVIIGLNEDEQTAAREFEKNMRDIKANTLVNIQDVFSELTGITPDEQVETPLKKEVDNFANTQVEISEQPIAAQSEMKQTPVETKTSNTDSDDKKPHHANRKNNGPRKKNYNKNRNRNRNKKNIQAKKND